MVDGNIPAGIAFIIADADYAVALGAYPQVSPVVGMDGPHGFEHLLRHVLHEQRREQLLLVAVHMNPVAVGSDPEDILVAVGPQAENAVVRGDQLAAASFLGNTAQGPGQEAHINLVPERTDRRHGKARFAQLRKVG